MLRHRQFNIPRSRKPTCIGTGLIALDVLINGKDSPQLWAGGSCGNVMTILSFLGWLSYPVATLGNDRTSDLILKDMKSWGVKLDFIKNEDPVFSPVVIERLANGHTNSRMPIHKFEFSCPRCGSLLPKYKSIPKTFVSEIVEKAPSPQVFYFDRVSHMSIQLAKKFRSQGALIVFEPCTVGKQKLVQKAINLAHVVKYSNFQLNMNKFRRDVLLEIQTLGCEGLRYRFKGSKMKSYDWKKIPAFHLDEVVDSAGAGDWCTAGLLHILGRNGVKTLLRATSKDVEYALNFGQALAAICCKYEGARGVMYNVRKKKIQYLVAKMISHEKFEEFLPPLKPKQRKIFRYICPSCKTK